MSNAYDRLTEWEKANIAYNANEFIKSCGVDPMSFKRCYVGITNDPARRKAEHDQEFNSLYLGQILMSSAKYAEALEAYMLVYLGFQGGTGGGTYDSRYVYILDKSFKKAFRY